MALTLADIDKFSRICGMLGSVHDGERAAAALKATEFLQARSLTWADLIKALPAGPRQTREAHWSDAPRTEAEWLQALKAHCWDCLSEWEQGFVADVLARNRWPLTERQREVLFKLKDRHCRVYA